MVKEIKAWSASNGKVFASEREAIEYDKLEMMVQWYHDNFIERDFDIELPKFLGLMKSFPNELIKLLKD